MANLITIGRLGLLFLCVALIYFGSVGIIGATMVLVALVFISDGLDGYVARHSGSTSAFGAVFDIAGDRIVENVLWIVFAQLRLIPVWIPLMVLTRGFVVDALRSLSYAEGMTAFGAKNMMRSAVTRWLTAGRFMRGFYGYAKAGGFVFLTGLEAYQHHDATHSWVGTLYGFEPFRVFGWAMVWSAVALTIVRGAPVIYDAWAAARGNAVAPAAAPPAPPRPADVTRVSH